MATVAITARVTRWVVAIAIQKNMYRLRYFKGTAGKIKRLIKNRTAPENMVRLLQHACRSVNLCWGSMTFLKPSEVRPIRNLQKMSSLLIPGCNPEKPSPVGSGQAQTGDTLRTGRRRVREPTALERPWPEVLLLLFLPPRPLVSQQ